MAPGGHWGSLLLAWIQVDALPGCWHSSFTACSPSSPLVVGFAPSAAGLAGDGDAGVPAVPQTELALAPAISVLQKNKGDELLPALRHHEHRHGVKAELPTCSGNASAKKNSVLSCARAGAQRLSCNVGVARTRC